MTNTKTKHEIRPPVYIKKDLLNFADEMHYRHPIVLKGIATNTDLRNHRFTLKRPDSEHFVLWSADTEFLDVTPSTLNYLAIFVRGHSVNGRFLADSVAAAE